MVKPNSAAKWRALSLATLLLTVNFWAWSLLGPLGVHYLQALKLSAFQLSALLAAPIIIGALGRVPLGLLADRYGGRVMFTAVSWLAAVPIFLLAGAKTYQGLFALAVALGFAGAFFAVGVPFVSAWFPPKKRGLALAIYITLQPQLMPAATIAYLSLAAVLGMGNGAVFALLGRQVAPDQVGSVTGIVGAAGGLGGFLPPLLMGACYEATGSYAPAILLLAATAVGFLVLVCWRTLPVAKLA